MHGSATGLVEERQQQIGRVEVGRVQKLRAARRLDANLSHKRSVQRLEWCALCAECTGSGGHTVCVA